jgi:hypothetical protein
MRLPRAYPIEDLLVTVFPPGFLLSVLWTVMYEIYNEDGSYYTSLMQEIIGTEGLFPYFVVLAALMAIPVGMVIDSLRQVLAERRVIRRWTDRTPDGSPSPPSWPSAHALLAGGFADRYALYRHGRATLLVPARAAGNLALVILVLSVWFVVKIIRMRGWHLFSWAFIVGTPIAGLLITWLLLRCHAAGIREFHQYLREPLAPPQPPAPEVTPEPSPPGA